MPTIVQQLGQGIQGLRDAGVNATKWIDRPLSSIAGAIVGDVISSLPSLSTEILNYYWPDNYELYDCIIQIVNPLNQTPVAQFDFTVMPENIDIPHKYRTQVVPTLTRNFVLDSAYEAPAQFTLKGNFGVNHKLVINTKHEGLSGLDGQNWLTKHFVTGYGICKRLEKIVQLSHAVDSATQTPYQTYLITRAFNASMRVEFNQAIFKQTVQKNRIWQYELYFTKITDERPKQEEEKLITRLTSKVTSKLLSDNVTPLYNGLFSYIVKYV